MRLRLSGVRLLSLLLVLCFCMAARAESDKAGLDGFPGELRWQGDREVVLRLSGVALREIFFFDVYYIAHYLEYGAGEASTWDAIDTPEALLAQPLVKQIVIRYARDIDAAKLKQVLRDSFIQACRPEQWPRLQAKLEKLLSGIDQPIVEGQELTLVWEALSLHVYLEGESVFTLNDAEFAEVLWSIWLGPRSVIDRSDLLRFIPKIAKHL